jgi:hypothetical protein
VRCQVQARRASLRVGKVITVTSVFLVETVIVETVIEMVIVETVIEMAIEILLGIKIAIEMLRGHRVETSTRVIDTTTSMATSVRRIETENTGTRRGNVAQNVATIPVTRIEVEMIGVRRDEITIEITTVRFREPLGESGIGVRIEITKEITQGTLTEVTRVIAMSIIGREIGRVIATSIGREATISIGREATISIGKVRATIRAVITNVVIDGMRETRVAMA